MYKFQQYRSRSGYWKLHRSHLSFPYHRSFNNIDPEVDTESTEVTVRALPWLWFQQYRSRSGYWKVPSYLRSCVWMGVSTISIQKWILKDGIGVCHLRRLIRFNNIDPEVDTERWSSLPPLPMGSGFQQYRSRSGYWKIRDMNAPLSRKRVSTISIQKWILKEKPAPIRFRTLFSFNNIDPEVDTESGWTNRPSQKWLGFNNIDPEVDTERGREHAQRQKAKRFQQYRSRSGYWKSFQAVLRIYASGRFQQYRSRSGYWKCIAILKNVEIACMVSTISIQKWILKVDLTTRAGGGNNEFQQYRSRSGYWKFGSLAAQWCRLGFQQYRSRSGYWKMIVSTKS